MIYKYNDGAINTISENQSRYLFFSSKKDAELCIERKSKHTNPCPNEFLGMTLLTEKIYRSNTDPVLQKYGLDKNPTKSLELENGIWQIQSVVTMPGSAGYTAWKTQELLTTPENLTENYLIAVDFYYPSPDQEELDQKIDYQLEKDSLANKILSTFVLLEEVCGSENQSCWKME